LALSSAISAFAEDAADDARDIPLSALVETATLEDLANMVVTDTKVAQSRNTVTQNIAVLQSADMERQPTYNRNVAELLRYTSGQFVNVLSRNDANWGAYAGLGPKYNSYLLDGLPIDSFVDPMSLDPWAFERIEAHKGPASVMYSNYLSMDFAGNEAPLAGITNLVLKDRIEETKTRIQVGYGSYDTFTARAYHQGRTGNLSYFVGASGERSDYDQYGASNSWLQTVEAPDYNKYKVYGKLSYAFDRPDHTFSLFAHYASHDGDVGRPNRDFDNTYGILNLAYSNQLTEAWNLQFKAGDRYYDRIYGEDSYPASLASTGHGEVRQRIRPMDLTLSFKHWGASLLTAGIDEQTVDYQTNSRSPIGVVSRGNDVHGRSYGAYLQEKVEWKDFVFRAGVRRIRVEHDYHLLGGNVPSISNAKWQDTLWSMGARYNVSTTFSIYANAGSSFMAPAAKQIGGTIPSGSALNGQLANPSLSPETGFGKDLGADWKPSANLTLGLRVFRNEVSGAIVDNAVSLIPSQSVSVNAGRTAATGVEFDVRHVPSNTLQWFANVTASRTKVRNPTSADQSGTEIPFSPDLVANLGLSARVGGEVDVAPYFQWVGRYYDSDSRSGRTALGHYGVLNARLQKELVRKPAYSANLILDLNNLLDRHYNLPFGFQDPGFNAWAGVDLRF
jgi:outer membrane receptor protein involved in Fe transport